MVWAAWQSVKANKGSPGVDGLSVEEFESERSRQLYKVWNRMASGSYYPEAILEVVIPKASGGQRKLGIPTVGDRLAQTVVKQYLEPRMEKCFHPDSYGYRPGRSAHQAIAQAQQRCWKKAWVIDLDIAGFFDELDHELLNKALDKVVEEKWCRLYIDRWLNAPIQQRDGSLQSRKRGVPQGGVISPLLANLFLHYAFDAWMEKHHQGVPFERYADDIVVHCTTHAEAETLLEQIQERMAQCKLRLHPKKTQIVFCPQGGRKADYPIRKFEFLGYEFKARKVKHRNGSYFTGFNPAVGTKACSRLNRRFAEMGFHRWTQWSIEAIAQCINSVLRGWIGYFKRFNPHEMRRVFYNLNHRLVLWARKKFKRFKRGYHAAKNWLRQVAKHKPNLFEHWKAGFLP